MSLVSSALAAAASVHTVARAAGRAGTSMAAASLPTVTVTVRHDASAENLARQFTRTGPQVGFDPAVMTKNYWLDRPGFDRAYAALMYLLTFHPPRPGGI